MTNTDNSMNLNEERGTHSKNSSRATQLLREALAELSEQPEFKDKVVFMTNLGNKFEKWFQLELAYFLSKSNARNVWCEKSRKCKKVRCRSKGDILVKAAPSKTHSRPNARTDIEFSLPNYSKKSSFAVEIKIAFSPFNFKGTLKDIRKANKYLLNQWDFRGFFYVLLMNCDCSKFTQKEDEIRRGQEFMKGLLSSGFAESFPLRGTNFQVIFLHWESRRTDKKISCNSYKKDFQNYIEELWVKTGMPPEKEEQ